jgi:AcrR family transcriptional regulator
VWGTWQLSFRVVSKLTIYALFVSTSSIDTLHVDCQYAAMARRLTATRERISSAALTRFSRYGFRRTSMEDIAVEAGVSRAALYLQFRNKEEIFRSLSQDLHSEALGRAEAALRGDQPLAERLRAAVEAKSLRFIEIAFGSPHGSELLDESNRLCGDLPLDAERRFQQLLAREFRRAAGAREIDLAGAGLSAAETADLFTRTASGLKGPGVTVEAYRKRVAAWVRLFVAGLARSAPQTDTRRRAANRRARLRTSRAALTAALRDA